MVNCFGLAWRGCKLFRVDTFSPVFAVQNHSTVHKVNVHFADSTTTTPTPLGLNLTLYTKSKGVIAFIKLKKLLS